MMRTPKTPAAPKCLFGGCKAPVCWEVRQLFGKRLTTHACAKHKPGNRLAEASEAVRAQIASLPPFYETVPFEKS
jgi:hypothetical protein